MNEHLHLMQEGIYYKWASVKMTLKFHFLWPTLILINDRRECISCIF